MVKKLIFLIIFTTLISSCGRKGPLEPKDDRKEIIFDNVIAK